MRLKCHDNFRYIITQSIAMISDADILLVDSAVLPKLDEEHVLPNADVLDVETVLAVQVSSHVPVIVTPDA